MNNNTDNAMYYFEKAPVSKSILHMAIPMILGMVVNMIYNITDAYFIGLLNNTSSLAAITLALPFITTIYLVGIVMGIAVVLFVLRTQVIGWFSSDPNVIAVGKEILTALLASTLFAGLSGLFTSIFQAFGKGIQSNIMSVVRGIVLVPIIFAGNALFGLDGVIWAMTASEFCACVVGMSLWLLSKRKIMDTPIEERMEFDPDAV